ncbi:MAG: hypothetical protein IKW95_00540 [Lachnospiraceae bacterium]|nr:hypothetical protein [Lachnospiraceae bacterium]
MGKKNHDRQGNSIKRILIAVLVLLCFLAVLRPEAFAVSGEDDSDTYEVHIWSRGSIKDSDGGTKSDTPSDSLLLRMESGEIYEMGFYINSLAAKPGTVFYVSGRNLKRYTFYEAYTLEKRGGTNWQYLSKEEIAAINNGEELRFTMPDGPFLLCFVVQIDETVPMLMTPTPTVDPKAQWQINVVGGHAEDVNRNVITAAKAGTTVIIVHDGVPGKYFNTWVEANYPVPKNTPVFSFTMPAQDVSYYAATTRTQHEAVLTLDASPKVITEDWELVLNALISFDHYSYPYYDLDRDGHNDILVQNNGDGLTIYKEEGYSLGNEYIWEGSLAYLGPITIKTNKNVQTVLTPTPEPVDSTEPAPTDYPLIFTPTAGAEKADDDSDGGTFRYKILLGALGAVIATAIIILLVRKSKKDHPADPGNGSNDWRKERVILNASNGESTVIKEDRGNFSGKGEDDNSGGNPE